VECQQHLFIDCYRQIVQQFPDNIAVWDGVTSYSHVELWSKSLQIAGLLQKYDLQRSAHVGLFLKKSPDLVASILGCWISGVVFVPLDPKLPKERTYFYAKDARLNAVLYAEKQPEWNLEVTMLGIQEADKEGVVQHLSTREPAYLLYSSGSTGTPKGVLVSHQGIVLVLKQQIQMLSLTVLDRILWVLSMQFDASISDIGVALLSGACLIIDEGGDICTKMKQHQITYADIPPAMLNVYSPEDFPPSLTRVLIGGEVCSLPALNAHRKVRGIVVVYGPTEATICTSMIRLDANNAGLERTIGFPLIGIEYLIKSGELWIAGKTLAIEYWNRPVLANKWVENQGKRYFRTGDLVSQNEDGSFQFNGRIDRQFKLRGRLIAPEEIETVFSRYTPVNRVFVIKINSLLYAFLEGNTELNYHQMISLVEPYLPEWMIPSKGMLITEFPTTPSGKIDKEALMELLPKPQSTDFWCSVFEQTLGIPVKKSDDFFALGGDSIAMLSLIALAQQNQKVLTVDILKSNPTPQLLQKVKRVEHGKSVAELRGYVQRELQHFHLEPQNSSTMEPILLTGATGFLGGKILFLLCAEGFRVRVLIRASTLEKAKQRIPESLHPNVDIVLGDLCDSVSIQDFIKEGEGTLFHCAAGISLGASFSELYGVNVRATAQLFGYPKLKIIYASTLALFLSSDAKRGEIIETDMVFPEDTHIYGAYAQTKWIAERLAVHREAVILRLGLITDMVMPNRRDWFVLFIRGLMHIGAVPFDRLKHVAIDITPLDYAAKVAVGLGLHPKSQGIYHIASSKSVSFQEVRLVLRKLGYPLKNCSDEEFQQRLNGLENEAERNALQFGLHRVRTDETKHQEFDMFLATDASFDTSRVWELLKQRCSIPNIDRMLPLIKAILELP
jgi:acyl-CoA synthetase (AMP-forming)/AMP-acid ligase II/nucleoside-diphosphate-sugar epimerase